MLPVVVTGKEMVPIAVAKRAVGFPSGHTEEHGSGGAQYKRDRSEGRVDRYTHRRANNRTCRRNGTREVADLSAMGRRAPTKG